MFVVYSMLIERKLLSNTDLFRKITVHLFLLKTLILLTVYSVDIKPVSIIVFSFWTRCDVLFCLELCVVETVAL